MINKNIIRFIFLFIYLFILGCSKNENPYFPLAKGYKWQYDVSLITRDGLSNQKYIFNNVGKSELNGEPVYLQESLDGSILYYTLTDKGIYYSGNLNSQNLHPVFHLDKHLVMPASLLVDTKWEESTVTKLLRKTGPPQKTVFKIIAKVPIEARIVSLNETVNVPAGQFENCMKILMEGFVFKDAGNYVGLTMVSVEQTSWYAPGVGLVKMERQETTERKALDKGSLLVELTRFESG